jgi:hypothetical protein
MIGVSRSVVKATNKAAFTACNRPAVPPIDASVACRSLLDRPTRTPEPHIRSSWFSPVSVLWMTSGS